jgi:A/G-specific adenine glycosylase
MADALRLAADPPAAAVAQWANLGYPRRALWLHRAAVEIHGRHDGVVPRDVDDLLALTGIGDYTARAVAVFAYGDRHPVVDTNTRRVLARASADARSPARRARATSRRWRRSCPTTMRMPRSSTPRRWSSARSSARRAPPDATYARSRMCAWRAADYPDTGDDRRSRPATRAATVRRAGRSCAARGPTHEMAQDAVASDWPDAAQRDRAIDSLIADGLVEASTAPCASR